MTDTERHNFPITFKARSEEAIVADGARPNAAAQHAQLEAWIERHLRGAYFPKSLDDMIIADETDAYAADGFMSANPLPATETPALRDDAATLAAMIERALGDWPAQKAVDVLTQLSFDFDRFIRARGDA